MLKKKKKYICLAELIKAVIEVKIFEFANFRFILFYLTLKQVICSIAGGKY